MWITGSRLKKFLEFLFGCDADVAQDGARELGKETLDEVEPGAMGWREGEFEAMCRLLRNPGCGLFGHVRGMIIEDQLNRRVGRIGGIEELEEFDDSAAAMTVSDQGMNLAADKVDAGQRSPCRGVHIRTHVRRWRACRARAADPERWLRSPGCPASRRRR